MKIRNKRTGEIREVPDGTLSVSAPTTYNPAEAPSASRSAMALGKEVAERVPGFIAGALNKTRETTSQPVLRFLANAGFEPAKREVEAIHEFNYPQTVESQITGIRKPRDKAPGESMGEMAADVGLMMAPTPLGKIKAAENATKGVKFMTGLARVLGIGAQGAAQHQAQNYARTGEVNPGEAALETGLTAGTLGIGEKIPGSLKKGAAGYLKLLTRAPKRLERGMNPPTLAGFEQALEEGVFPILKGGYKAAEKRGIASQVARDAEKSAILDREGVRFSAPGARSEAEANINARAGGRRGLTPTQMEQGVAQLDEYTQAAKHPFYEMNRGGFMPGAKAIDLRKLADANADFVQGKTPQGLDLASQEFRSAVEDQLGRRMAGKSGEARYQTLKKEMATLAPVIEAFGEKAASNYSLAPELITGAAGAFGGNPWLAAIPALRRAPQVAPAFYELGRGLGNQNVRAAGRTGLNLARSAYFGGNE